MKTVYFIVLAALALVEFGCTLQDDLGHSNQTNAKGDGLGSGGTATAGQVSSSEGGGMASLGGAPSLAGGASSGGVVSMGGTTGCSNGSCTTPPVATCPTPTSIRRFSAMGTCSAALTCEYASQTQACASGEFCTRAATGAACTKAACGPTTCPDGCCDIRGNCVAGTRSDECGMGGQACRACPSAAICYANQCNSMLPKWRQVSVSPVPPGRAGLAMAFDPVRGVTVLFGGMLNGVNYNDTWEYDGATWSEKVTLHKPLTRRYHMMAFDPLRKRIVLFGGVTPGTGGDIDLADTWEYDGNDWFQVMTTTAPSPRSSAALVADETTGILHLSGGGVGRRAQMGGLPTGFATVLSDWWTYQYPNWTLASSKIGYRFAGHAAYFDAPRNVFVLVGGDHGAGLLSAPLFFTVEVNPTSFVSTVGSSIVNCRDVKGAPYPPLGAFYTLGGFTSNGAGNTDCSGMIEFKNGVGTPTNFNEPTVPHALVYDSRRKRLVFYRWMTSGSQSISEIHEFY